MKPANLDHLTRLKTRATLESMRKSFAARSEKDLWSFVMIDIDHFKLINDVYGHLTGDQVLAQVAALVLKTLRKSDTLVRFGGDEFLAILQKTHLSEAFNVAERTMESMSRADFPLGLQVSLSIGISESRPGESRIDDPIDRADKALYGAKDSGRAKISFYSEPSLVQQDDPVLFGHFIGRQAELKKLRQMLDESLLGKAQFALVQGDAGIGKTRMIEELMPYAKFRKCKIFSNSCFLAAELAPYGTIIGSIRSAIAELSPGQNAEIGDWLGAVHPATAELFPELKSGTTENSRFFREEGLKFKLLDDLVRIVHAFARISPLLIVVDDIQWMPPPDWELFAYLVRSSISQPIFFLVSCRSAQGEHSIVSDRLAGFKQSIPFLTVFLGNLAPKETSNLIMFALKDPNIPQEVLDLFIRQSGGNPYFAKELLQALIQKGLIRKNAATEWTYHLPARITLPDSLQQLISSRLTVLKEESLRILKIAALLSGTFSVEMLASVTSLSDIATVEALEQPLKLGLIRESNLEAGVPEYEFIHETVRSYLLNELPASMKIVYHSKIASFYESLYMSGNEAYLLPMAYHFGKSNQKAKACGSSLIAARLCNRRQANRETIRWIEHYLSLVEADSEDKTQLLYAYKTIGRLSSIVGKGAEAEKYLNLAKQLADQNEDMAEIAGYLGENYQRISNYKSSRLQYLEAIMLSADPLHKADHINSLAYIDHLEGDLASAESRLNEVESLLQHEEESDLKDKILALFYLTRAVIEQETGSGEHVADWNAKASELFRKHNDLKGEATVLNNMCDVLTRQSEYEKAIETLHQSEAIAMRLDDKLICAIAHYNLAETYAELNQSALSEDYFQRYLNENRIIGNAFGDGYAHMGLGNLNFLDGKFPIAENYYRKAVTIFAGLGGRYMALLVNLKLIQSILMQRRFKEASQLLKESEPEFMSQSGHEIQTEFLYIRGLSMHLSSRKKDSSAQKKAARLLLKSLKQSKMLPLHSVMERYYFLCQAQKSMETQEAYKKTLKKALRELDRRLSKIENPRIRANVCKRDVIEKLLKADERH